MTSSPDGKPVVLFDGVCNLCNGWVKFVVRRDPVGRFRFASLQSPFAAEALGGRGFPRDFLGSIVLLEDGVVYTKSDAVLRVARGLRAPWPLFALLRLVPRTVRDVAYDWIARNRYRWFGKRDACMLPSPQDAARFIA